MLGKSKIKLIRSLEHKKYRHQNGLFLVEGDKMVREILLSSLEVKYLFAKPDWLSGLPDSLTSKATEITEIDDRELSQISFLKTPNQALALVKIPQYEFDYKELSNGLSLYLDEVQDPGNLGTIIRVADWFGIHHIVCGVGCADPYNPKAVQSTMGALIRVKTYQDDTSFFRNLNAQLPQFPIYGTFLDGENLYQKSLPNKAVIVMGNESKGISSDVEQYVNQRILIPSYPPNVPTSESLNVAIATAIVCAEFRRTLITH